MVMKGQVLLTRRRLEQIVRLTRLGVSPETAFRRVLEGRGSERTLRRLTAELRRRGITG